MEQAQTDSLVNGIPTAHHFRISLDLVSIDRTSRDGGALIEPILRRLAGAEPYRDFMGEESIAWLRFVRRACCAALSANQFSSPRQKARVDGLRQILDHRIVYLTEHLPACDRDRLARPIVGVGGSDAMLIWLRSGSRLGFEQWRATVYFWALEDGAHSVC